MRNVPYYHEILVIDEKIKNLKSLLKEIDNRFNPYLINLLSLSHADTLLISEIEEYLSLKIKSFDFPYPIYILSPLTQFQSKIKIFKSKKDIPGFYFFKEKRTTRVHANISRLNISAEKTFDFNHQEESVKRISKYAHNNKTIHFLTKENNHWKKTLFDLKKYDKRR